MIEFNYNEYPDKINLGCGWDRKEGFLNVDAEDWHNPDLVADVRDLTFLPSSYYEYIYARDILEHINRTEIMNTLSEWYRLLKPGGSIYIQTSNIINLADLLKSIDYTLPENEGILIQCMFGTQAYDGDYHRCGFTPSTLEYCLRETGFRNISIFLKDHWLLSVNAEKPEGDNKPEFIYSYGFYNIEDDKSGIVWSQCDSEIITNYSSKLSMKIQFPKEEKRFKKQLFIRVNGGKSKKINVNSRKPTIAQIDIPNDRTKIKFESNYVYTPNLLDSSNPDKRKLSFYVYDVSVS